MFADMDQHSQSPPASEAIGQLSVFNDATRKFFEPYDGVEPGLHGASSPALGLNGVVSEDRRQSQIFYAQKYGLNTPSMYGPQAMSPSMSTEPSTDPSSEYSAGSSTLSSPIVYSRQHSSQTSNGGSVKRPTSYRNAETPKHTRRPSQYVKPAAMPMTYRPEDVPSHLLPVLKLYESFNAKVYMGGYLMKQNDITPEGKPFNDRNWSKWYVELCGPILSFWDAESVSGVVSGKDEASILPHYTNITDCQIAVIGDFPDPYRIQPLRTNVFALNTAGANRFYLSCPDQATLNQWISAIRLASFEIAKLHEIYTRCLCTNSHLPLLSGVHSPLSDPSSAISSALSNLHATFKEVLVTTTSGQFEGHVQARLMGKTDWQKYWLVITSDQGPGKLASGKGSLSSIFSGTKKTPPRSKTSGFAQCFLYANRKSKEPIVTITAVHQAYAVYPETPQLVDKATIFKLEGNMLNSQSPQSSSFQQNSPSSFDGFGQQSSGFLLLMSSSPREMASCLVTIWNAFQLYGRPQQLLDSAADPRSLIFGATALTLSPDSQRTKHQSWLPAPQSTLFLNPEDVKDTPLYGKNAIETKMIFLSMLTEKLNSLGLGQRPITPPHAAGSTLPRINSQPMPASHEPPFVRQRTASGTALMHQPAPMPRQNSSPSFAPTSRPQSVAGYPRLQPVPRPSYNAKGKVIVDSSGESEEDSAKEEDEDSDDEPIIHVLQHTKEQKPTEDEHRDWRPHQADNAKVTRRVPIASDTEDDEPAEAEESDSEDDSELSAPSRSAQPPRTQSSNDVASKSTANKGKQVPRNRICSEIFGEINWESEETFARKEKDNIYDVPIGPQTYAEARKSDAVEKEEAPAVSSSRRHSDQPDPALRAQLAALAGFDVEEHQQDSGKIEGILDNDLSNKQTIEGADRTSYGTSTADSDGQQQSGTQAQSFMHPNTVGAGYMAMPPGTPGYNGQQYAGVHPQFWNQPSEMAGSPYDDEHRSIALGEYLRPMNVQGGGRLRADDTMSAYGGSDYYERTGPQIPALGQGFAKHGSLLGAYLNEKMSAMEQTEFAKATGQPLINVPQKPPEPQTGLIGMITQREAEKKAGRGKIQDKLGAMREEIAIERERERRLMEQRQQYMMQQQMMMRNAYGTYGMGMMNQLYPFGMMPMMSPMMSPGNMTPVGMIPGQQMPMMMNQSGYFDPRMSMMAGGMSPMSPYAMGMGTNFGNNVRNSMYGGGSVYGGVPPSHFGQQQAFQGTKPATSNEVIDEDDNVPIGLVATPQNSSQRKSFVQPGNRGSSGNQSASSGNSSVPGK
ncbi:hypothetical protein BZG36_00977 [Bifiguratus adelaidae]|uniref:PH domain-containing protein n=1 Tax=Bifiguratus adelaidae TaxID=1938954 RepID=A0A261Y6J1_9FUNG|nr:hypothetical protein BZG36_00977 [Bifiguratus adelaidae]